jgi:very-short-patch-repair endonuclease
MQLRPGLRREMIAAISDCRFQLMTDIAPGRRPKATTTVAQARALRKRLTPQEARLWQALRQLRQQGLHFRRQVPIERFVVDFACLRKLLIIEVDGAGHSLAGKQQADAVRDHRLAELGFEILRFQNSEINNAVDDVVETIILQCRERSRETPPSPEGREAAGAERD